MTAINQDFKVYAGNDARPIFTVQDSSGAPIDISTAAEITFTAQRNLDAGASVAITKTKTGGGIVLVAGGTTGKFQVILTKTDTAPLSLSYFYQATLASGGTGDLTTVSTGQMTVGPKPLATYSGDPSNSTRDLIRALVGDTDMDSPVYTDQVYDGLTRTFGGPLYVAAQVCRMLGQKYAGKATKRLGDLSISYGEISKNFFTAAADYQAQADAHGGGLYAAGISKSDRNGYSPRFNCDAIGAFTTLKAFDNRGASGGFAPDNLSNSGDGGG